MKTIISLLLLLITGQALHAQFTGDWYAFRIEDMVRYTIASDYVVISRIGRFHTPQAYTDSQDTFRILRQHQSGDSLLYIVTQEDHTADIRMEKFVYDSKSRHLKGFYFYTAYDFQVWQQQKGTRAVSELPAFIAGDTSQTSYVNFYQQSEIDSFLRFAPLAQQSRETVIALYKDMTRAYQELKVLDEKAAMPYFALRGMSKSVIRVPFYLKYGIYPLLQPSGITETQLKEQYKYDREVLMSIYEFEIALR